MWNSKELSILRCLVRGFSLFIYRTKGRRSCVLPRPLTSLSEESSTADSFIPRAIPTGVPKKARLRAEGLHIVILSCSHQQLPANKRCLQRFRRPRLRFRRCIFPSRATAAALTLASLTLRTVTNIAVAPIKKPCGKLVIQACLLLVPTAVRRDRLRLSRSTRP